MAEGSSGANQIESKGQALSSDLRSSWTNSDRDGLLTSARSLCQLFPDLLPSMQPKAGAPKDYYGVLGLRCDVPQSTIELDYLRAVRKFQRAQQANDAREEYCHLLNAGLILRKPRLRLSHDLVSVRQWLIGNKIITENGELEPNAENQALPAKREEHAPRAFEGTIQDDRPLMIQLLHYAGIIGLPEIKALMNQSAIAPEIPLWELILTAGYVTESEMNSLKLAQIFIEKDKMTKEQFKRAFEDDDTDH